jgi:uncharacterized protein YbjT (DUF2867 family)
VAPERTITVFGGTGFLGRRIVARLREAGAVVRVASRHPARVGADDPGLQAVRADVSDARSIANAVAGAQGVVNAVSLYVEQGRATFRAVHVDAAARVAAEAQRAGVARLVHVSGIGADAASASRYIASRGAGEQAVRAAFPGATIVRPAVMIGPGDAFITAIAALLRRLPAYPLFGRGDTRLQPVHVDDVAAAVARAVTSDHAVEPVYELAGPTVYRYEDVVRMIARQIGARPLLIALPFPLWRSLAALAEVLPAPPITRNQVELMETDNVAAASAPGFAALGIAPRPLERALSEILPAATP